MLRLSGSSPLRFFFSIVFRTLNAPAFSRPWPLVLETEHGQDHGSLHILDNILANNTWTNGDLLFYTSGPSTYTSRSAYFGPY